MKQGIIIYHSALRKMKGLYSVVEDLVIQGQKLNMALNPIGNSEFYLIDKRGQLKIQGPNLNYIDFVIFLDKDLILARALEKQGLPLFNSSKSIELCDDKILTWENLLGTVPLAKTSPAPFHYKGIDLSHKFLDFIEREIKFPCIIKEAKGSFGEQVYLVHNKEEAKEKAKNLGPVNFLFQEFVSSSYGRDIRVLIVGDKVLGAIERSNQKDFRANIALGGKSNPISLSKEEEEMALRAHKKLGLSFSGVDLLYGENGPLVCEVNSNMSYLGFQEATGISVGQEILKYIKKEVI